MKNWCLNCIFILTIGLVVACSSSPAAEYTLDRRPLPDSAVRDSVRLRRADLPARDLVVLTEQYKRVIVPEIVEHPVVEVGDTVLFWYEDQENEVEVQTSARLVGQTNGLNMWVEAGVKVDQKKLEDAMTILENEIFPTNRALFGQERSPGIDGDERLNILHVEEMGGGVIGYFSSADAFPPEVNSFSNSRDMFYINLEFVDIGDPEYFSVVAHEFQHMIHWHVDRSEMTWLNEGLSELAAAVNGYGDSEHLDTFVANPDTPLMYFDYEGGDYGAAYLFARYLYERFGPEQILELVQQPLDSADGVEAVFQDKSPFHNFEFIFASWVVDSYAAARGLGLDGSAIPFLQEVDFPDNFDTERLRPGQIVRQPVEQFGTDFWRVTGRRPLEVVFNGSTQVPFMSVGSRDGGKMWSTLPGDDSVRSLTRKLDVTDINAATLTFDLWYDIEREWDFGYVAVSTDGEKWSTVETTATTTANPRGTNLGAGYTGKSGSGREAVWIEQAVDLTPYLDGDFLWVQFLYVTDDAIFNEGMSVDNIRIPEVGFEDSAETDVAGWDAQGFVRHSNILPQKYIVQTIMIDQSGDYYAFSVQIENDQTGRWEIPFDDRYREAIIAVSGATHTTIHPSIYELKVES